MPSGSARSKRLTSLFLGKGEKNNDGKDENGTHFRTNSGNISLHSTPPASSHLSTPGPNHLRHATSAQNLNSDSDIRSSKTWRNVSAPVPGDTSKDEYLVPPPSLTALNPDLQDSGDAHRRRQSWGGISSLAASLSRPGSRSSLPPESRPQTPNASSRLTKGRSWVSGKFLSSSAEASKPKKEEVKAWIVGGSQDIPYDVHRLAAAEKVPELWDDQADTYVYLFPQKTGKPASFKVDSALFADSTSLTFMARGADASQPNWPSRSGAPQLHLSNPTSPSLADSPQAGPYEDFSGSEGQVSRDDFSEDAKQELHLYLPIPFDSDVSSDQPVSHPGDIDLLVLFRNLFAFLIGQSLVATPRFPTVFDVFYEIAGVLSRFEFSNLDGSTFGEIANTSFGCYCDELGIFDVRKDTDKILNAIILGERMRYLPLYQEGYVHGVGKLEEIRDMKTHKYSMISPLTQKRLERGYLDLDNRLRTIRLKLEDFDFPSLFSGIANSNMINEAKVVRFKNWKSAYLAFRKHILSYYRAKYGSWPPKANSKKNQFEEGGLNRLVLNELYRDFADLYDMLVDRTLLTTRSADMTTVELGTEDGDVQESLARALRQVMSEYDRSTPPVQPPVPFDLPQLPNIQTIRRKQLDPKKLRKESGKRLSSGEVNEILLSTYNHQSMKPTQFLEEFIRFERRVGSGKSCDELIDNRCGQWIFLYAVIQALPMVVVDAVEVKYTEGVEYFLCIPPRGGCPWCQHDSKPARSWFGVSGGSGVVSLPSDLVTHGVEGIYRRSHCWQVAAKWATERGMFYSAMDHLTIDSDQQTTTMPPPPLSATESSSERQASSSLVTPGNVTPPTLSLAPPPALGRAGNRSSIHIGLEALPLPPGVTPMDRPPRSVSHNPNLSFDHILEQIPKTGKK
ncbi:hypothetical protein VTO42DRAFT_2750 [Malbranchea cinnamomea]